MVGIFSWSNSTPIVLQEGSQTNVMINGCAVNSAGYNGAIGISGAAQASGDVNVNIISEGGIGLVVVSYDTNDAVYNSDVIVNTNKGTAVATVDSSNAARVGTSSITIDPDAGKRCSWWAMSSILMMRLCLIMVQTSTSAFKMRLRS